MLRVPPDAVAVTFVRVGEEEVELYTPLLRVPPDAVVVTFVRVGEEEELVTP